MLDVFHLNYKILGLYIYIHFFFQTINFKRTSYAIKYKGIDKENYLNKRDAKDTPNYFAAFTLVNIN